MKNAVSRLGGHYIIDFAWLGSGEVIIVELNPFDGVCLGTFPASRGMFLWDDPSDRRIMTGKDDFEFRLREVELNPITLKMQCSSEWRKIIYNEEQDIIIINIHSVFFVCFSFTPFRLQRWVLLLLLLSP